MSVKHFVIEPRKGWIPINYKEIAEFRDLFLILAMRDVKLRYKQTALGVAWVLLQPLITSLLFALIFGRVAHLPSDNVPYLLFAFAGVLPWLLVSQSVLRASNSLVNESKLISKVYFPRILVPLASAGAVFVDFSVSLIAFFAFLPFYDVPLTWQILFLPFFILLASLFGAGVSLFLAALNVYYRDFVYALPFFIQIWMYASPLVYSSSLIPQEWRALYYLNPMAGIIDAFRWALLGLEAFPWTSFTYAVIIGLSLFLGGAIVFRRIERNFADVI